MTFEEVVLKLRVDMAQVDPTLNKFKAKVGESARESSKWFQHAAKASEAFKRAIEQISDKAPALGAAMKIALNPISGTLLIAVALFEYFSKKIEEANAALDEMGRSNAKPLASIKEAAEKAADEMSRLNAEFKKFHRANDDRAKDITDGLEKQTDELESQLRVKQKTLDLEKQAKSSSIENAVSGGRMSQGEGIKQKNALEKKSAEDRRNLEIEFTQKKLDAQKAALAHAKALQASTAWDVTRAEKGALDPKTIMGEQRAIGNQEDLKERLRQQKETTAKLKDLASDSNTPVFGKRLPVWNPMSASYQNTEELDKQYADSLAAEKNFQHMLDESSAAVAKYKAAHKDATDIVTQAQKVNTEANDKVRDLSKAVDKTTNELNEKKATPAGYTVEQLRAASKQYLPTIQELAESGTWNYNKLTHRRSFTPGPFANVANRIQYLQADAVQAGVWGNMGRHNADVMELNRLKGFLREAGVIDPADAQVESEKHLSVIAGAISGGAMSVDVKNAD